MSAQINILNHHIGRVVKLTEDQEFYLMFSVGEEKNEYRINTNWNTGKYHGLIPKKLTENRFEVMLPCDNTGLFFVNVQYREVGSKKWIDSDVYLEVQVDPSWIYDAIVYNVFLRSFNKEGKGKVGPGEGGTFEDVIAHMDELAELGINVLYLNPFHQIGELFRKYNPHNHIPYYLQPGSPYSIKDFKSIDPEVAFSHKDSSKFIQDPNKMLKKLVDAAHKRGLRVIMDLVFNHTAHDFVLQKTYPEWFLYKENTQSVEDPYIYPEDVKKGKPWGNAEYSIPPFDNGEFGWTDTAKLNWEFNSPPAPNLPPKNTKLKEMYEYFKSVPKYWIKEFGIDGFRTDITYSVPLDFWRECIWETRKAAKRYYPHNGSVDGEVVFIGETWQDMLPELQSVGFSYLYGSYAYKIYSPQTLKGYLDYMYNIDSNAFPENARWFIFPECHDFERATSKLVPHHLADDDGNKLSEKDRAAMVGNISRWVLTACLPGMPMVFSGFEKVEWVQVDHISYSRIDWNSDRDIYDDIAIINKIRHNHIALQKGNYQFISTSQGLDEKTQIFSFARYTENELIYVVVNMDVVNESMADIHLSKIESFEPDKQFVLKDLLTGKIFQRDNDVLTVKLAPGQSHIFLVEQNWGD